jgi:hypothetical protein
VADSTGDVADAKVIENLALDSTAPDKSAPRNEHYYWLWVLSSSVFGVGLVLVAMKVFYTPRRQSSAGRKEGDDKVSRVLITVFIFCNS